MDVVLPRLGENIASAEIVRVLVKPGQDVKADEPLMELETNKAVVELPSPAAGRVSEVLVSGGEVKVGQAVVRLETAEPAATATAVEPARPVTQVAPAGAEPGAASGATPPPPAAEPEAPPQAPQKPERVTPPIAPPQGREQPTAAGRNVPAAPSVRRLARELGVTLADVRGSGRGGRIAMADLKRHVAERMAAAGAGGGLPPLPDFGAWGPVRRERMSHVRRLTAQHLTQCWSQIAHVTQFDAADITALEALRLRYADRAERLGGKLTMAVMVVKVAAQALRVHPKFNASVDMRGREIIYKDYVNVGIAVSTERGLLVPVLRDADRKNMVHLAAEVSAVAEKARKGTITVEELQGGTFTVTNLGNIGGTHFTPIVNFPEVAILGMGRAHTEAQIVDGVLKPRIVLPLSLSYDHRLIDGAEGARFLKWIVEAVEEPLLLALEG